MYGKFFASTFTGSMYGAGSHVFALWGYVIANAIEGAIEINPRMVASILGADEAQVETALALLCGPDPRSRSKVEDGRRLVHEAGFQYRVVNHGTYRAMRNEEERRAYNREAQRKHRSGNSVSNRQSLTSKQCQPPSAHTEAEAEAEAETEAKPKIKTLVQRPHVTLDTDGFKEFWQAYPKQMGRLTAQKAWHKLAPSAAVQAAIHAALIAQKASDQWTKHGGQFIPHPTQYVRGELWMDAVPAASRPRSLGPDYPSWDWREECGRLHSGRCENATFHVAKMVEET
jgi:hypothetical protein